MPRYQPTPEAHPDYIAERDARVVDLSNDEEFKSISNQWRQMALERKYMNNFSWLGRPIIQLPGDIMAVQELISSIKPTVVVETGIAHGGSLLLSASVLHLNKIEGKVIGVDIDIRPHNYNAIRESSFFGMIELIEGSSIDEQVFSKINDLITDEDKVMVFLDSNHTHDHVMQELDLYSRLVSIGSYMVVFDTHVEDMPDDYVWEDRPWGKGNNPKTAVHEWIVSNTNFEIDNDIEHKVMLTSAPDGFLFRRS